MVASLYSTKTGRTKTFQYDGVSFGWETIEIMFKREVQRAKAGVPRRVPGLRESYVYRDIWTRPNVKPAKIMQVRILNCSFCTLSKKNVVYSILYHFKICSSSM